MNGSLVNFISMANCVLVTILSEQSSDSSTIQYRQLEPLTPRLSSSYVNSFDPI